MLATHAADAGRLRFPMFASPKLDGIRLCITDEGPVTRGGGLLPNERFRKYLDREEMRSLDGELTFGNPVATDVVQRSIGAAMSRKGPPPEAGLIFWVFDSFADPALPFTSRYQLAERSVERAGLALVQAVPQTMVRSPAEIESLEERCLSLGFEGLVLRSPDARYSFGRVEAHTQALLKLKRREHMTGEIVGVARKESGGVALVVRHPEWAEPFDVPVYGKEAQALARFDEKELAGRKARFTRLRGSWKRAPRSPLFTGLAEG